MSAVKMQQMGQIWAGIRTIWCMNTDGLSQMGQHGAAK